MYPPQFLTQFETTNSVRRGYPKLPCMSFWLESLPRPGLAWYSSLIEGKADRAKPPAERKPPHRQERNSAATFRSTGCKIRRCCLSSDKTSGRNRDEIQSLWNFPGYLVRSNSPGD